MAGVTAHGGTFTFGGTKITITSLSVEAPQATVVDMTSWREPASNSVLVPTGEWTGGSIQVDYITKASDDLSSKVRTCGPLQFTSDGFSVTRRAILESATTQASTGDIVRGTLKFRLTDYTATITQFK